MTRVAILVRNSQRRREEWCCVKIPFTPSCAFGPCLALGRFLDLLLAVGFIGFLDAVVFVLVADTLKFP